MGTAYHLLRIHLYSIINIHCQVSNKLVQSCYLITILLHHSVVPQ